MWGLVQVSHLRQLCVKMTEKALSLFYIPLARTGPSRSTRRIIRMFWMPDALVRCFPVGVSARCSIARV